MGNAMQLMGKEIMLTYGPLFTVLVAPIIVILVNRLIRKIDRAAEERHDHLVKEIMETRSAFGRKLDEFCKSQDKLHKQIDDRFWKHDHTEKGDVVIRGWM